MSDELTLLVMVDPAHRDRFGSVASALDRLGTTPLRQMPKLGLIVVRARRSQLAEICAIDAVLSVEESQTWQTLD